MYEYLNTSVTLSIEIKLKIIALCNVYQSHTSFAKVAKRSNSFLHFTFHYTLPCINTWIDKIRNFPVSRNETSR